MTTPTQARSGSKGVRTYPWPPHPPHEFQNISVTSVISGGLPKPFLVGWAAKMTAEAAVEDHEIVGAMLAKGNERAAIDHLKGARYRDTGEKADRGTIVHAAVESYLAGKSIDTDEIHAQLKEARVPTSMWKSTTLMVSAVMDFLADEEPDVHWSEATVYSRQHGYAGTADIIATMRVGGSLAPVVIDVKTSKRVYDETALQLCAYAKADFVGMDDGTEMPLIADGRPIDHGVVVRPTPSGKYEKVVFSLTPEVFGLFLACLHTASNAHLLEGARRP